MPQTKDAQIKEVVVGLALGTLAEGVTAVTSQKMTFESAFTDAWHRWNRASEFPSISGHDRGNLFWIGVAKSKRRTSVTAAWSTDRWTSPYLIHSWTVEETLDHVSNERTTADDWRELGALFVAGFKPGELVRYGA